VKVEYAKADNPVSSSVGSIQEISFTPFPGMNNGSFIGMLRCILPADPKTALGFHLVALDAPEHDFYYFDLIGDEKLIARKREMATILFTCNVPQLGPAPTDSENFIFRIRPAFAAKRPDDDPPVWQIRFAGGDGMVTPLGFFTRKSGNWVFVRESTAPTSKGDLPPRKSQPLYVFAGGAPKSGTTWVEKIFNSHGDILCNGEGGFFLRETQLRYAAYNYWLPGNVTMADLGLLSQAGTVDMIFRAYDSHWRHEVYVDRAPAYSYSYFKALGAFPDAKIIHTRRHPLDVAVSRVFHEINLLRDSNEPTPGVARSNVEQTMKLIEAPGGVKKGELFRENWGYLRFILDEWVYAERCYEVSNRDFPGRAMSVVYEDLLQDFRGEVRRLLDFVGVSYDDNTIKMMQEKTSFKELSGGRKSGEQDAGSFFRKGVSGDHRNYFDGQQIKDALNYVALRKTGSQNIWEER
jgi:hypothetical protein